MEELPTVCLIEAFLLIHDSGNRLQDDVNFQVMSNEEILHMSRSQSVG